MAPRHYPDGGARVGLCFGAVARGIGRDDAPGAINIFTCTPNVLRWTWQRFRFWTTKRSQWVARHLNTRELGTLTLRRLDILHSATWLQLGRFPAIPGCRREELRHVLFCSNFAGEWDPYRQAFLDVVGSGVKSMWGSSLGFNRRFPRRGTRYDVEAWAWRRLPPTAHYYRAYPGLAPSTIRGAVRLTRELEQFAFNAAGPIGPGPDRLFIAFRQLQARMRDPHGAAPPGIVAGAVLGPRSATAMSNFASVLPILPGREQAVLARIRSLPGGVASPFHLVEGTHFARLAVLDRRTASFHVRKPIVLRHSWLLFVADIDGHFPVDEARSRRMDGTEISRYMDAVDRSPVLRSMWQDCVGFRPDRPLAELIAPSVIDRFVLFLDHGDLTLREIDYALRVRHEYLRRLEKGLLGDRAGVEALLDHVRSAARSAQRRP